MKAILLAIMAGLCWGIGELFTKQVLLTHKIGPLTAIAIRSTIALPILWATYFYFVHYRGLEPRNWLHAGPVPLTKLALGSGIAAGALGMIFFYLALHAGHLSRVKPIAFTVAPAMGVLLGWLVLHEPMSARKLVGITAVVIGVLLLTSD